MSAEPSIRDYLYEEPGPKTRRAIRIATVVSAVLVAVLLIAMCRQFAVAGQLDPKYWSFFLSLSTWRFLGMGLVGTLEVALTAGVISLVLGALLMFMRLSQYVFLRGIARVITEFFRGVPSLLLIYFFFLVIPQYGIKMPTFWMITAPVALAASAVLAEVFRAGMQAVPQGQREAGLSLGMRPFAVTLKIVFPQALRMVIPSLISQLVVVVKDTTLAYVVSFPDMLQNARVLIANYDALLSTYIVIAAVYVLINYAVNYVARYASRRMGAKIVSASTIDPV